MLWANRMITMTSLEEERAKKTKRSAVVAGIKKTSNMETGKDSKLTSFSEGNWGPTTRKYMLSINKLRPGSMKTIIEKAKPYCKVTITDEDETGEEDDDDERANLMDLSDDD